MMCTCRRQAKHQKQYSGRTYSVIDFSRLLVPPRKQSIFDEENVGAKTEGVGGGTARQKTHWIDWHTNCCWCLLACCYPKPIVVPSRISARLNFGADFLDRKHFPARNSNTFRSHGSSTHFWHNFQSLRHYFSAQKRHGKSE